MFPKPIDQASKPFAISYRVAVPVTVILWLVPMIAVFLTSMRSLADITAGNYWGFPFDFSLIHNYLAVFQQTPMLRYLFNSLVITIPSVVGAIALSTLAGFALAKYKFRFSLLIFAIFIGGNFVPFQILMVPVRDLSLNLGIYNTYFALILFHLSFQTGFCVFFMRNFIAELPDALFESARTEGVSEWKIFIHIALPLVRPALAALAVLIFTFVWNDFFWALVLVSSDSVRPVTTALQTLQGQYVASWHLVSAAAIIAAIPPVVLFFFMQRHFVAGLTFGATKG